MTTPYIGQIVHYQHGTDSRDIRPAIVLQILDTTEYRCALQLFGNRYGEYAECLYCETPRPGTWHYIPKGEMGNNLPHR